MGNSAVPSGTLLPSSRGSPSQEELVEEYVPVATGSGGQGDGAVIQLVVRPVLVEAGVDPVPFCVGPVPDPKDPVPKDGGVSYLYPIFGCFVEEGCFAFASSGSDCDVHRSGRIDNPVRHCRGAQIRVNVPRKHHVDPVLYEQWFEMFLGREGLVIVLVQREGVVQRCVQHRQHPRSDRSVDLFQFGHNPIVLGGIAFHGRVCVYHQDPGRPVCVCVIRIAPFVRERVRGSVHVETAQWTVVFAQLGRTDTRHPETVFVRQKDARPILFLVNVVIAGTQHHGDGFCNGVVFEKVHEGIPPSMVGGGVRHIAGQNERIEIGLGMKHPGQHLFGMWELSQIAHHGQLERLVDAAADSLGHWWCGPEGPDPVRTGTFPFRPIVRTPFDEGATTTTITIAAVVPPLPTVGFPLRSFVFLHFLKITGHRLGLLLLHWATEVVVLKRNLQFVRRGLHHWSVIVSGGWF